MPAMRFNPALVARQVETVLDLTDEDDFFLYDDDDGPRRRRPLDMRYFNLLDPPWLVARGQGARHPPPNDDTYDSWLLSPTSRPTRIVDDTSLSQSLWARKLDGRYFAIGGEDVSAEDWEFRGAGVEGRDGLRVLEAESLDAIRRGAWMTPAHTPATLAVRGNHAGCATARQATGYCMFDNKVSAARWRGRWMLYARANLKKEGGRHVQVAASTADSPHGPYAPFELLRVEGYDAHGPGNIYFIAVEANPVDAATLVGLLPINEGEEGKGNGDGPSYIGVSVSCDGVSWSKPEVLVWSTGREGRTYDHPVDGWLQEDGALSFLVHNNVPHISPFAAEASRIVKFEVKRPALRELTAAAKLRLGCPEDGPSPPPPSTPPSPPPSPSPSPPPPPSPSPFPSSSPLPLLSPPPPLPWVTSPSSSTLALPSSTRSPPLPPDPHSLTAVFPHLLGGLVLMLTGCALILLAFSHLRAAGARLLAVAADDLPPRRRAADADGADAADADGADGADAAPPWDDPFDPPLALPDDRPTDPPRACGQRPPPPDDDGYWAKAK
ncbi:hypothetical protein AB1Y20_012273 [Prymnesium parvum]|uniref:Uncharacterized protein n=1 Tax=Prymnesium parvum TaxID=97485 RepID=A0AB34IP98_PRYPA